MIVVNAKTEAKPFMDRKAAAPHLGSVLLAAATTPMADFSFDTVEMLGDFIDEWNRDAMCDEKMRADCPTVKLPGRPLNKVAFYPIVVDFNGVEDPKLRDTLKSIPTTFELPASTVDSLTSAGAQLLRDSTGFKKLLADIGSAP